jgi:competence transcription factor ComK
LDKGDFNETKYLFYFNDANNNTTKCGYMFRRVIRHHQATHAHKTKITIANLEKVAEINEFKFSEKFYQIAPCVVLQ